MTAETGYKSTGSQEVPPTEESKKFDSWYNRVSSLIGELSFQINTIRTKSDNLYKENVTVGEDKLRADLQPKEPAFIPMSFYDCLTKIENDLEQVTKRATQIEINLNKII